MDENTTPSESRGSTNKMLIPATVLGIIVLALVAFYVLGKNNNNSTNTTQTPQGAMQAATSTPTSAVTQAPSGTQGAKTPTYKDGKYDATGNYVSPGGSRAVDVTLTLKDGVITDATFQGNATDPNSKRFQGEFKENFEPMVVGKNIDEVNLTKVAGSSLSPKGFMDALDKIKEEAQA